MIAKNRVTKKVMVVFEKVTNSATRITDKVYEYNIPTAFLCEQPFDNNR